MKNMNKTNLTAYEVIEQCIYFLQYSKIQTFRHTIFNEIQEQRMTKHDDDDGSDDDDDDDNDDDADDDDDDDNDDDGR